MTQAAPVAKPAPRPRTARRVQAVDADDHVLEDHRSTLRTPARRLAVYRAWLMALTACSVALITVVPAAILARAVDDPTPVLMAVGVLFGWLATFIGTWITYEQLPR